LAARKWNRHERGERSTKADIRRNLKQKFIRPVRHQVFFSEQLESVGQRLQPAEFPANARGPEPVLNAARNLALHPDEQQRADRDQIHKQTDLDERSERVRQPGPHVMCKELAHNTLRPN